ncbi:MAG: recombinase family protein [Nitrosopumilus sp.]|nr:recombinase family protein [Nitrosopumilus sp.]
MKSFVPITQLPIKSSKMKMAAIYARVSSDQQKKDETIESQLDILIQMSKEHGYEVPTQWIIRDEAKSGPSIDRPGLDFLRDIAFEGVIDAIFIYATDRLARSYVYQSILHEEFVKNGVQPFYYKSISFGNTPEEKLLMNCQAMIAEYEHAMIIDRTRRGKLYKVRKGVVAMLPTAPYGYNKIRGDSFYKINDKEAQNVREIFRLFVQERLKLRQICLRIEKQGIKAPKGGLKWDSKTLKGILENTSYIGTAYFGKTEKCEGNNERTARYKIRGKVTKSTKARKPKPRDLWEPLSVPQFISENDFEMAQMLLQKNKELSSRNTKEPSILQGLLLCGLCGCSYYKKRRVRNGINQTNYSCHSHLLKEKTSCGNRSIRQETLDKLVWDNIVELLKNPELIENEISRRCNEEVDQKPNDLKKLIHNLKKDEKKIGEEYDRLLDAFQATDCISIEQLRDRCKNLKEKGAVIKKEIDSLEALNIKEKSFQDIHRTLKMFTEKLEKSFDSLSIKEKQIVARSLIADVVILPNELEIRHVIPLTQEQNGLLCGVGC